MPLNGKIIKLENGRLGIECISRDYRDPTEIRHVWEIPSMRATGFGYCTIDDAIGRAASINDGRVSCYLGEGKWLEGQLAEGGSTKAIIVETREVPKPKVKAGISTRWRDGRWEKHLLRQGWIAA
jgi:hypothetical protein